MSTDQVITSTLSTVALVGSPNSGKTTLFNWLTGSKFKTVNYAGSTIEVHRGATLPIYGEAVRVLDTPGIYSLQPHGADEEVTLRALTDTNEVKAVIVVIDGTQLNRQLYLVRQVMSLRVPMVIAVTMMDIVRQSGRRLDLMKLSELIDAPVFPVDGRLGGGVGDLVESARRLASTQLGRRTANFAWDDQRIEKEIAIAEDWTRQVVRKASGKESLEHLRRWDDYALHPFWGIFIFVLVMGFVFSSVFWLAAPLMKTVDFAFGLLVQWVGDWFGESAWGDFLANGVISGIGSVMVFVPQIFILFFGLTLLEDSGYLARAATIVDRPLNKIGLSGRAFVPILSGFACAVPAVLACRNIRSARERWITVFIIPFMTCSARLPVYALLLTFLFASGASWLAGITLTGLYVAGMVIGAIAAGILHRLVKGKGDSHFLMELPIYRWPKLSFSLQIAARRTQAYVQRAGPTIFAFALALWIGTHFPSHPEATPSEQLSGSVVGQVGHWIEPVFAPMGLDWRAGLGMLSAFVAREVFVSSMAVIFSVAGDAKDPSLRGLIMEKMKEAHFPDGTPLFTVASVAGLLVFFMIALQCLSTTSVTLREMGSWKYAIVQLVTLNLGAYLAAILVVQGLRAMGVA